MKPASLKAKYYLVLLQAVIELAACRVDPVEVAHVVRVHEHVQVPAHRTRFVTDIAIESGLAPLEVLKYGAHGVCRNRELRCARAVPAQRARDIDRDVRRWAHSVKLIIGGCDDATKGIAAVNAAYQERRR